eukprot:1457976-Rhodomonas_salina.1
MVLRSHGTELAYGAESGADACAQHSPCAISVQSSAQRGTELAYALGVCYGMSGTGLRDVRY